MTVAATYTLTNQCGPAKPWSVNCTSSFSLLDEYPGCKGFPAVVCVSPVRNLLAKGELACCQGTSDDAGDPAFPRYLSVTITSSQPGFCDTLCCNMNGSYLCEWVPPTGIGSGGYWEYNFAPPGANINDLICDPTASCPGTIGSSGMYRSSLRVSCLFDGFTRSLFVQIYFMDRVEFGFNSAYEVYRSQGTVPTSNLCFGKPVKVPQKVPLSSYCDIGDIWIQAVL